MKPRLAAIVRAVRIWVMEMRVRQLERGRDAQARMADAYAAHARKHRSITAWYERQINAAQIAVREANSD